MKTKRIFSLALVVAMLASMFTSVNIVGAQSSSESVLNIIVKNSAQQGIENFESYGNVLDTNIVEAGIDTITRSYSDNDRGALAYIVVDPDNSENHILRINKQAYDSADSTAVPNSTNFVIKTFNEVCDSEYIVYSQRMKLPYAHTRMRLRLNYKPKLDGGLNTAAECAAASAYNLSVNFKTSGMLDETTSNANMGVPIDAYIGKWVTYTLVIDAFDWTFDVYVDDTYYYTGSFETSVPNKTANYISGIVSSELAVDRVANASATPNSTTDLLSYYDDFKVNSVSAQQANAADLAQGITAPSGTIATGAVLDTVTPVTNKTITWTTNNSGVTVDENGVVYVSPSVTDGTSVEFTATFDYATGDVTKVYTATVSTANSAEITDVSQLFDIYKNRGAYVQAVYDAAVNQMNPNASDYKDISNNYLYSLTNEYKKSLGSTVFEGTNPTSESMYFFSRDEITANKITYFDTVVEDQPSYNYFAQADNRLKIESSTDAKGVTKDAYTNYSYYCRDNDRAGDQAMVFGIADTPSGETPYITSDDSNLTILVEYLDQAEGDISMTYWSTADALDDATSIIPGTGIGEWKTAVFKLTDAKFYEYSDFDGTGMCDGRCDFNINTPKGTGGKSAISRVMVLKTDDIKVDTQLSIATTIPTETVLPVATTNFNLPVTWTSDNKNVTIDKTTGTVTVAANEGIDVYENVTLTANYGVITQKFTVTAEAYPLKYAEYKVGTNVDYAYGMSSYNTVSGSYYTQVINEFDVRNPIVNLGEPKTFYFVWDKGWYSKDATKGTYSDKTAREVTKSEYDAYVDKQTPNSSGVKTTDKIAYTNIYYRSNSSSTGDSSCNRYEAVGPENDKRPALFGVQHLRADRRLQNKLTPTMLHFNVSDTFGSTDNVLTLEFDVLDVGTHQLLLEYIKTDGTIGRKFSEELKNTDKWVTVKFNVTDADFSKESGTRLGDGKQDFRLNCSNATYLSAVRVYNDQIKQLKQSDYTTVAVRDYDAIINMNGSVQAKDTITAEQAADAKLYIAVYDAQGDLVEVATSDLINNNTAATIKTAETKKRFNTYEYTLKTFLWDSDLKPYR